VPLNRNGSVLVQVEKEDRKGAGWPRSSWKAAVRTEVVVEKYQSTSQTTTNVVRTLVADWERIRSRMQTRSVNEGLSAGLWCQQLKMMLYLQQQRIAWCTQVGYNS